MSKPNSKKTAHQQRKHSERLQKRKNRKMNQSAHVSGSHAEPLYGEIIGVPTSGANWLGRCIASLVRRRK